MAQADEQAEVGVASETGEHQLDEKVVDQLRGVLLSEGHDLDDPDFSAESLKYLEVFRQFSGPLPHPSVLADYDTAVPNGAERIFTQFEEQGRHRRRLERERLDLERTVLQHQIATDTRGQWMAYSSALLLFLGAGYLVSDGVEGGAIAAALGGVALVISVFYASRRRKKKDSEEEADD